MNIDDFIHQLAVLNERDASEVLTELEKALETTIDISPEIALAAAYIAGVEDALTGNAGRAEYDLRRGEFIKNATNSLSETGRKIGDDVMLDVISQAIEDN